MVKQQREMSKYVIDELHHIQWETENGDGYFPFTEEDNDSVPTWETFHLNEEGQWIQEWMPPIIHDKPDSEQQVYGNSYDADQHKQLTAIKGFEGDDGEKLLRFLNEQTRKQQLENGVDESDVFQGTVILHHFTPSHI